MGPFHKVTETKNLAPGQGMAVEVGGNKIALFNVDGTCYAIADTCTHRGAKDDHRRLHDILHDLKSESGLR